MFLSLKYPANTPNELYSRLNYLCCLQPHRERKGETEKEREKKITGGEQIEILLIINIMGEEWMMDRRTVGRKKTEREI